MNRQDYPGKVPSAIGACCVFCLDNKVLQDKQIIFRGSASYLAAPLGQWMEGYLTIAPYQCGSCLSQLPVATLQEISNFQAFIERFYRVEYGCDNQIFYEQGRAGGGASYDEIGRFPYHAHLCGLPVNFDLHSMLGKRYQRIELDDFRALPQTVVDQPYILAKADNLLAAYIGGSELVRLELEHSRLTPQIAKSLNRAERSNWRDYPGHQELNNLLIRLRRYQGPEKGSCSMSEY